MNLLDLYDEPNRYNRYSFGCALPGCFRLELRRCVEVESGKSWCVETDVGQCDEDGGYLLDVGERATPITYWTVSKRDLEGLEEVISDFDHFAEALVFVELLGGNPYDVPPGVSLEVRGCMVDDHNLNPPDLVLDEAGQEAQKDRLIRGLLESLGRQNKRYLQVDPIGISVGNPHGINSAQFSIDVLNDVEKSLNYKSELTGDFEYPPGMLDSEELSKLAARYVESAEACPTGTWAISKDDRWVKHANGEWTSIATGNKTSDPSAFNQILFYELPPSH